MAGAGDCAPVASAVTCTKSVWVPNIVTEEVPYTVYRQQMESVPYTYTVTVCKPETRTRTVPVTTYNTEERTRNYTVTVCKPETRTRTVNVVECKTETANATDPGDDLQHRDAHADGSRNSNAAGDSDTDGECPILRTANPHP